MRKAQDDVMARTAAERLIGDMLAGNPATAEHLDSDDGARVVREMLGEFEAVEFERTESKVRGGTVVPLRRIVITTGWEVDPDGIKQ